MVFNATFNNMSCTPEYPEKTTDLSQVTDKTLSHNVVSSTPRHEGTPIQLPYDHDVPLLQKKKMYKIQKTNNKIYNINTILAILFRPSGFLRYLNYLAFKYIDYECT